jgi:ATP synthase protein I
MTENGPGQDPELPEDSRLQSLDERLRQAKSDEAVRTGQDRAPADRNEQLGNRVLSYLIGGPVGGALIGWVIDRMLGTFPTAMLILLFLGMAAGFWSIIKLSTKRPE